MTEVTIAPTSGRTAPKPLVEGAHHDDTLLDNTLLDNPLLDNALDLSTSISNV